MRQTSFDDLVQTSVREAMSKMLGSEVWKAISFYFDVGLVAKEPASFAKLLDRLVGASSRVLQQKIGETLLSKLGSQPEGGKGRELQDLIQMAWAKFSSSAHWTMP